MAEPTTGGKNVRQINIRVTHEEANAIQGAADAMDISVSDFVHYGLLQAATDLGMLIADDARPRLAPDYLWQYAPQRPDGVSSRARLAAYLHPRTYAMAESAAFGVRLSLPHFAIGAALRFAALQQLRNERRKKGDPFRSDALEQLSIPYGFAELVRATRR